LRMPRPVKRRFKRDQLLAQALEPGIDKDVDSGGLIDHVHHLAPNSPA
jgi:hypothetical protein